MSGRMQWCVRFVALWLMMACVCVQGAEVRAWLDRNTMQLGETVTLNVEVSDGANVKPDFSVLESDFNLSGTQSSTSINIVNGQSSSKLLWAVALEPKHSGTLTIPSLSVAGQSTQPLMLTVQTASTGGGKAGDDLYIETTVEPRSPYVQQQVSMTVKLYFSVNVVDGQLEDPQAPGLIVRKVSGQQDTNFSADVGGRRYRVLERRYVLQAEKSGSIALAPIIFRGHAMDRNDANSFFSRGHNVSARSDAITLDVRPRPANSGADAWLPARSVTLSAEGIDNNTEARVGEPLTLTLRLQATGLGFEQLPELTLPKIDGADIYPDKASTQNKDSGDLTTGERERKFAIVPKRAGSLVIPPISVGWWDTTNDRPEAAAVPEIDLNVQPAAGVSAPQTLAPAPNPTAVPQPTTSPSIASASRTVTDTEPTFWRVLALVAIVLWIATVAAWIFWSTRQKKNASTTRVTNDTDASDGAAKRSFRDACAAGDWSAVSRALLAWARSRKIAARNLRELADAVNDAAQIAAIEHLESVRYGTTGADGLKEHLTTAFRNGPHSQKASLPAATPVLPHLYPPHTS